MNEFDDFDDVVDDADILCPSCAGTGVSAYSNRPDDHGPHSICEACRGTGEYEQ